MKLRYKFKDGSSFTTKAYKLDEVHEGTGFMTSLVNGIKNSETIEASDTQGNKLEKTYADLESIEIILS